MSAYSQNRKCRDLPSPVAELQLIAPPANRELFKSRFAKARKMNDIDPKAWLADVLARIAEHPAQRLDELLPWNWKKTSAAKNLAA